jgi:hypothetical protein
MQKVLISMVMVMMASVAQANDREVFGAVLGAVIGYQIAKATEPRVVYLPQQPVYQDNRTNRVVDLRHPQPQSPRCWNRLDRINQYGQPIYMQECL